MTENLLHVLDNFVNINFIYKVSSIIIKLSIASNIKTFRSRQELYKEFGEWLYSISLHPDGLYLIVGLEKSLKLMNIFIDELVPLKSFPINNCRSVRPIKTID